VSPLGEEWCASSDPDFVGRVTPLTHATEIRVSSGNAISIWHGTYHDRLSVDQPPFGFSPPARAIHARPERAELLSLPRA